MKTSHRTAGKGRVPGRFDELVKLLPPRVLHDEADYENVIEVIGAILARPSRTNGQEAYVETWSILIEEYEASHHAMDEAKVTGLDALNHLLEQHEMNGADLGRLLGNVSLGSKILRGERELSKAHMRVLADYFHVSPSLVF